MWPSCALKLASPGTKRGRKEEQRKDRNRKECISKAEEYMYEIEKGG
jgi:hypothetical protein